MYWLVKMVNYVFQVYSWLIIARIIFSWIQITRNKVVEEIRGLVYDLTEPYLRIFRRFIPVVGAGAIGLDLTPLIGFIVLRVIQRIVNDILIRILLF